MRKKRRYAPYFDWHHKRRKELGILEVLLETMRLRGDAAYHSPEIVEDDPPDCTVRNENESLVAVEITELVSEEAAREAERRQPSYEDWEYQNVVARIDLILKDKDTKQYSGGPYSKTILVIHTDEYTITYGTYARRLKQEIFSGVRRIDEAYLLFSFDPYEECCPYVRLRLGVDKAGFS